MASYYDRLQDGMQPIVKKILERHFPFEEQEWSPLAVAAALHFYIYHKIPYEKRHEGGTRPFRPPHEAWKKGGNCQEKTVALASLYDSVKAIHTRMLSVVNEAGDAHLLVELGADLPRDEAEAELDRSYQQFDDIYTKPYYRHPSFYVTEDDSRIWFLADPEMSRYLGDASALSRQGFISGRRSQWSWNNLRYYVYPEIGRVPA
jgi:hypothetical protein